MQAITPKLTTVLETEWTPIASGEDEPSGKTLSLDSQGELEDCQIPRSETNRKFQNLINNNIVFLLSLSDSDTDSIQFSLT